MDSQTPQQDAQPDFTWAPGMQVGQEALSQVTDQQAAHLFLGFASASFTIKFERVFV